MWGDPHPVRIPRPAKPGAALAGRGWMWCEALAANGPDVARCADHVRGILPSGRIPSANGAEIQTNLTE